MFILEKKKMPIINDLSLYLKKLGREELIKFKISEKEKLNKDKSKISDIEYRDNRTSESRMWFFSFFNQ